MEDRLQCQPAPEIARRSYPERDPLEFQPHGANPLNEWTRNGGMVKAGAAPRANRLRRLGGRVARVAGIKMLGEDNGSRWDCLVRVTSARAKCPRDPGHAELVHGGGNRQDSRARAG